jgi:iron complex outermembrane receptor protein
LDFEQQTFDLDYQYRFPIGDRNNVICGASYRHMADEFVGTFASIVPAEKSTNLFSYFIQDEITLIEDWWYLTAGSKFLHNDFTGFEFQPSVRLLCTPSDRETIWAAVSRAVQTPSRLEDGVVFEQIFSPIGPTFTRLLGNPYLEAEQLLSFELGYRAQPRDDFYWDLATFYNHYESLTGFGPSGAPFFDPTVPAFIVPLSFSNDGSADTYGAELTCNYEVRRDWRLTGSYSYLYIDMHDVSDIDTTQGASPHNRVYVRSSWDLSRDWQFDLIGRYVDNLPAFGVPSYLVADMRLDWQPYRNFDWAIVARNLFDSPHPEFVDTTTGIVSTEVQAEVFTTLTWTY